MYTLIVLDEVSSWDEEQRGFVTTREELMRVETEDARQYRRLVKQAKSSWRSTYTRQSRRGSRDEYEYEQHTVCLLVTEPDENGVFVEKKLQYTRMPYPHHRLHLWLEVADWRSDAEAYKMAWTADGEAWREAVRAGQIKIGPDEQKAWEKRQAKEARDAA